MKRIPIKKFLLVLLGIWLAGISGCGEQNIVVLISPRTAIVPKGAFQQFTVEVINTQDIAVAWSIDNDTTPPSKGTIDANGLYHPPENLPNPNTVTIRVTSNADPSISDTATVTLTTGEVLSFGTNQRVTDSTNAVSTISSSQHSIQVNQYTPNTPPGNTLIATTIYTVWNDNRNGNNDIFFDKKVIDPAGTPVDFGTDVPVNNITTGEQTEPSLAIHATTAVPPVVTLYAAWTDTQLGNNDIFMATSLDGGATWNASTQVNDPTNESFSQVQPSIVVDSGGGNVYIAWTDNRNGDNDIFFAKGSVDLTTGAVTITHPCSGGTTDCRINDDTIANGFSQSQPSLAFHNNALYAAWTDNRNGNSDIFLARSTDSGTTWSQNIKVNDAANASFTQTSPSLAVTTVNNVETIYVAWQDDRNGTNDIYFAKATVGAGGVITIEHPCGPTTTTTTTTSTTTTTVSGSTTTTTTTTTTSTTTTTLPEDCRVNDDTAALGWPDTANQTTPSLTLDKFGNIYIAWQDNRNDPITGTYDIFFAKSMDGGLSFGSNSQVNDHVASSTSSQTAPSLAVDSEGQSYVIWTDERNKTSTPGVVSDVFFATGE